MTGRRLNALAVGLSVALLGLPGAVAQAAVPVARAIPGPADPSATVPAGARMAGFANEAGQPAVVQTSALCSVDATTLSLRIVCLEPNMAGLVAKCQSDGDSAVFQDDCLEVFLSPTEGATGYLHFATNANGARYAEKGRGEGLLSLPWTVQAARSAEGWTVVLSIPLSTLGARPGRGGVWRLNICRQRQAGGELQLSAWSPTDSNFHDSERFGVLVFDDAYNRYLHTAFVTPWERRVKALGARVQGQAGLARRLAQAVGPSEASLQPLREAAASDQPVPLDTFGVLLDTGQTALKQLARAETSLEEAAAESERRQALMGLAEPGQDLLVWATTAITDARVLPTPEPPRSLSANLALRACRGEFEPAAFVVYPLRQAVTAEVSVSDLRGPGVIPADAVDVRAVKCWYQSGGNERFPINHGLRLMTPELLLRDDGLIRVDTARERNYVKLQYPDGRHRWLDITQPEPSPEEQDSSVEAMPIRDATTLQPVTIPARTAKQFWVTVHVPADARSGMYHGSVRLQSEGETLVTLPLSLEVLPFDLAENPLESSIYFHWGLNLDTNGPGSLQISKRNPAQLRAELQNLLDHGVDNPTVGVSPASGQLPEELKLRQEVGMRADRLYYLVAYTSQLSPEQMREVIATARGFGFSEFYFYGNDEAAGDRLTAQRADFEKVHAAGGKVFVAGSGGQNFPLVGDLQDLLVCYGDPDKEEAARWHSKGHKVFSYANPQGGIEAPETYRRNFGLLLAANDYDGGMTYIYYSGTPSWGDWCIPPYRQHNFVYPTVDGVIDTVQWEGYREGIDDLRYLGTLRQAIADAAQRGGRGAAEAARAQAYLDRMDVTGDLYALRGEMIRWITRLRP
jgi:hypothetical protein